MKEAPASTPQHVVMVGKSGPTSLGWHQVKDFMQCPKQYQFKYIRGIHEPLHRIPDAFAVGSLVHAGRARWFARGFGANGRTWRAVVEAVQEEAEAQKLPITVDAEKRALVILEQFIRFWAAKPLPTPIATEYLLGPAPLVPGDPSNLWRTSKPDDISEYPEGGKGLWLGDCKTTSQDISDCVREYELNGQFLLMKLLYNNAPQGLAKLGPINGVMLDIIKKPYGKDKTKFARHAVVVTDASLAWFVRNMQGQLRAMGNVSWDADVPRNFTYCTRLEGRMRIDCAYKGLCRFGRTASARYVFEDGKSLVTWKPTADRKVAPWA